MIVQIWVNDQLVDMYSETDIKFTYQVNDIAEVKDRQANYTNSFNLPRTANNIRIFEGLGEPSDSSTIPYNKIPCRLSFEGFDIVSKGWMRITDTTNREYKIHVYSGLINFFKKIENKNLSDLSLNNDDGIKHTKDLLTVKDSVDNEKYRYIWADYNGRRTTEVGGTILNIDQLVPSVRVKYLFEKLHSQEFNPGDSFIPVGNFMSDENFTNLWMTYTKAESETDYEVIFESPDNAGSESVNISGPETSDSNIYGKTIKFKANSGSEYKVDRYYITKTGYYTFELNLDLNTPVSFPTPNSPIRVYYIKTDNNTDYSSSLYDQIANGNAKQIGKDIDDILPSRSKTLTSDSVKLNEGESVLFFYYWKNNYYTLSYTLNLKVNFKDIQFIDPSAELADFKIIDFLKEVINFFGLTIFYEEDSNIITYKTLNERINSNDVLDWSDKYIERTSEQYVFQTYAQKNIFEYKYSDDSFDYNNGSISVNNVNLEQSKTILKSKMYSPERLLVSFPELITTNPIHLFKMYDKEIDDKKNPTDLDYIKYKPLSKRYFFMRSNTITGSWTIGSRNTPGVTVTTNKIAYASWENLSFSEIISIYYRSFNQLLTESRLHNIELNLNLPDILTLSFDRLYYFKQEQQYYLLNKLNFDDKKAKGEFVKINKPYTIVSIFLDYSTIICVNEVCLITLSISVGGYIPDDMILQRLVNDVWVDENNIPVSSSILNTVTLSTGNAFRIKYTDSAREIKYSNVINY